MKKKIKICYQNGEKFAGLNSKTLVSALIGMSSKKDYRNQIDKIDAISKIEHIYKPDIISDLSIVKGNNSPLYKYILSNYPDFIVSTLPIYLCSDQNGSINENELLEIIYEQIESGVSLITIHPTPKETIIRKAENRMVPWTSRGGGIVIRDLINRKFKLDNVYLRIIDEIIKIAFERNVVISIGASFRSANIFDSCDSAQLEELEFQESLGNYISDKGVGVIIEGPGHCSPKKIKIISKYYTKMEFPIMPLGPLPTDIAIGNDHIASSIGSVILGIYDCVDIIAAVTREEHTGGIPSTNSTIEAIISTKIAAHIIDLHKLDESSADFEIASYRAKFQTCIYGKANAGCNRCLDVCPLRLLID